MSTDNGGDFPQTQCTADPEHQQLEEKIQLLRRELVDKRKFTTLFINEVCDCLRENGVIFFTSSVLVKDAALELALRNTNDNIYSIQDFVKERIDFESRRDIPILLKGVVRHFGIERISILIGRGFISENTAKLFIKYVTRHEEDKENRNNEEKININIIGRLEDSRNMERCILISGFSSECEGFISQDKKRKAFWFTNGRLEGITEESRIKREIERR